MVNDLDPLPHPPLENHKWVKVSLEILVRIPLEKQFDPMVLLLLKRGPYDPLKCVDDGLRFTCLLVCVVFVSSLLCPGHTFTDLTQD